MPGCGSNHPETAKVKGTVLIDGAPLTKGTVQFYPDEGQPARGEIQPDGSFELTTFKTKGDGAVLGEHTVTVQATEVTGGGNPASIDEEIAQAVSGDQQPSSVHWLAPERYSQRQTTDLKVTVVRGENMVKLELTKKP